MYPFGPSLSERLFNALIVDKIRICGTLHSRPEMARLGTGRDSEVKTIVVIGKWQCNYDTVMVRNKAG